MRGPRRSRCYGATSIRSIAADSSSSVAAVGDVRSSDTEVITIKVNIYFYYYSTLACHLGFPFPGHTSMPLDLCCCAPCLNTAFRNGQRWPEIPDFSGSCAPSAGTIEVNCLGTRCVSGNLEETDRKFGVFLEKLRIRKSSNEGKSLRSKTHYASGPKSGIASEITVNVLRTIRGRCLD